MNAHSRIGLHLEVNYLPTIKVKQSLLANLLARDGITHDIDSLADKLPLLGTDIDLCDNEDLEIEIFPDRPDLLSAETLTHAMGPFLHNSKPKPELDVISGNITMEVEAELKDVRPVIFAAIVRGVDTGEGNDNEDFIKGLMDHQEKLHFALGRGRRRASIGVHDLSELKPPFRVKAVNGDYSFTPLAMNEEMTIKEILTKHPKGIDYAHLLDGMNKFPIIIDANNAVLSFPPIINGDHTTVSSTTRDFFIDVTGWDARSCESSLLLICLQLARRGGIIESVTINDCHSNTIVSPNGETIAHQVPLELVKNILGWDFSEDELSSAIMKMGGRYIGTSPAPENSPESPWRMADAGRGEQILNFQMPRWRFDILHPIDLVEELAIGHGYDDLGASSPSVSMAGIPRPDAILGRRIKSSLQGLGLQQVQSLTLSNDNDQFIHTRWKELQETTRITNPITTEHTLLRQYILPSLLRLISANRHNDLPQMVYELGTCVSDHNNRAKVSWLVADTDAGFAHARGFAQALLRDLGAEEKEISWQSLPEGHGPWLTGRSASISVSGMVIGEIGELDPTVSESFSLKVPMHGAEFDVSALMDCIADPVL